LSDHDLGHSPLHGSREPSAPSNDHQFASGHHPLEPLGVTDEPTAASPEQGQAEPAAPLPASQGPAGGAGLDLDPRPATSDQHAEPAEAVDEAGEERSTRPSGPEALDLAPAECEISAVPASELERAFEPAAEQPASAHPDTQGSEDDDPDLYSSALDGLEEIAPEGDSLPGPDLRSGVNPRHMLEGWLSQMVEARASDLILRAGGRPSCRVDGRITFLPGQVPSAGALQEVLEGIIGPHRMGDWRKQGSTDVALQLDGLGRFRLNAYRQLGEPALVLRRIAETPPKLEALCLPTGVLQKLAKRKRGIILVTGVAGSGKSTTLAAMIQHMNETSERHVITLEDPVELMFKEDRCVISQREVGTDVPDFSSGLRHCLRQSPDVILIGEMRDAETVQAALDATETGHLVMSTLHTVNAAQTVDRIISFFPQEQHEQVRSRLADNMAAVLSQRLLPRSSGRGMVPALELLTSTPRIAELLGEGRTAEISREIETSEQAGLISFNRSLRQLVEAGLIELEVALSASDKPDELLLGLRGFNTASARNQTASGAGGPQRPHLRLDRGSDELTLG
jgi:twitching motility protein PilT